MSIGSIAVIGAGTIGNGIAQVAALAGIKVLLIDVSDAAVTRGVGSIGKNLDRLVGQRQADPRGERRMLWPSSKPAPAMTASSAPSW